MFDKLFLTLQLLRGTFMARLDDEEGATMVEYGLMVALVAVIVAVGAGALGIAIDALFDEVVLDL